MSKNGFTLIELMIVVVIIGLLAGFAIPKFNMASHRAKLSEAELMLKHIYQAHMTWTTATGGTTTDLGDLESVGYSTPASMAFYSIPAPSAYGLPLCLESKNPAGWPSMSVDATGELTPC
jgi:prepilin-type N-terminal cleavage/methylation domain-containing protein